MLAGSRWSHILLRHPYLEIEPEVVLATVAQPDERRAGHALGEEWFYRRGAGPSAWIRVVVHYEHNYGVIVTAFPRRSLP